MVYPGEIDIVTTLGGYDSSTPIYLYDNHGLGLSVKPEKGVVESMHFRCQGVDIDGYYHEGKIFLTLGIGFEYGSNKLAIEVTLKVKGEDSKLFEYRKTIHHTIVLQRFSEESFELVEATIDRFVFRLKDEMSDFYKLVIDGEEIEDLNRIVIKRDLFKYKFPTNPTVGVNLLKKEQEYMPSASYQFANLTLSDKKLGDFTYGVTPLFYYIDKVHQALYAWNAIELIIFDKELKPLNHFQKSAIKQLTVTPQTGLVAVEYLYKGIKVYKDKNMNSVVSTFTPQGRTGKLCVNERDQLFNEQNSNVDVYDLHTGNLLYTIPFDHYIYDYTISGNYLLVGTGNDGINHLYLLHENSASHLHSFTKKYHYCIPHPTNPKHIVLDYFSNGFHIFDIESRDIIKSFDGQFQNIDPFTGNLLYYDENYGVDGNYQNHLLDVNYNKIFEFEDDSRHILGAFILFNNHIIKGDNYTFLLSKE